MTAPDIKIKARRAAPAEGRLAPGLISFRSQSLLGALKPALGGSRSERLAALTAVGELAVSLRHELLDALLRCADEDDERIQREARKALWELYQLARSGLDQDPRNTKRSRGIPQEAQ